MKKSLPAYVLCLYTSMGFASINPITITYLNGTAGFFPGHSGTANYVVTVNANVIPPNTPLTFHLSSTGNQNPALSVSQITSGLSPCDEIDTLCGSNFSLSAGQSCCLALTMTSSVEGNYSLQPTLSTTPPAYSAQALSTLNLWVGQIQLTSSLNTLALSVNDASTYPALTGTPRQITITNTSTIETAYNVTFTEQNPTPANPIIESNCGDIAPLGYCTLTVTPTSTATAPPYTLDPAAITLTIQGDNTNILTPTVQILTYGSVYESGYVYAIDDTYANNVSVGGTVAALNDQTTSTGIIWSSNGSGALGDNVSNDIIPLISNDPDNADYNTALSQFDQTYENSYSSAFPPSSSFLTCDATIDGACNTTNILTFYNTYMTNYGSICANDGTCLVSAGPTPLSDYAAGLCKQTIDGYNDWYLPSICEEGYDGLTIGTGCGTETAPTTQNMNNNLPFLYSNSCTGVGCLQSNNNYWSSTTYEDSVIAAWFQIFSSDGSSLQAPENKYGQLLVRCSRALTPE